MPRFAYIAADADNNVVKGKTNLADRATVVSALTRQNLRPISIRILKDKKQVIDANHLFESTRVKQDHLVVFTRELSTMVSAGVPLLRALSSLEKHMEDKALKKILGSIIKDVESGMTLGDALAKHPDTFNDIYVNMVRAGEAAGILDEILDRIAAQQEKSATVRKKIRGAMAYPIVLLIITVLAFFGLMLFIVPRIGDIVKDLGGPDAELPGITLFMLAVSDIITGFWFIIIPGLVAAVIAVLRYTKTKKGRRQYHKLLLALPGIKSIVQKIAVARFARTFSALMGAGVAVLEALNVTARAVGNVMFEEALRDASIEVRNGKPLSSVIENNDLFPVIVAQMLAVGEETGQTDTVLIKVADFYDEEVDLAVGSLSSIIEPAMIIIMGSMVGLIAASVMLPIAQLSQNIQ